MTDSNENRPPHGDWLGTPYVRFERHGSLAHCIVDRPEARNAMTGSMYFAVRYAVNIVATDEDLAGMLLTGTGDVFIPGGDLSSTRVDEWGNLPGLLGIDSTPFEAIRSSAKPVVSAVNGICQGGGMLMAMLSDVAVASERATFRAPELYRGIADTGYATYLPTQVGVGRARDLLFTGRTLSAAEACDWGIVTRVVSHQELLDASIEALVACCRTAPDARLAVKRIVNDRYGHPDRMSMEHSLRGDEVVEGWRAFSERRAPSWIPEDLRPEGRL
ncbi:MAG TPA: enoyl-CoA hydratase/isomerase family protein [Acidimicrobiales bacterium]|nr:enoyl-CoA hydratase/isomerase family protein [Acidimicrobiales bacterium]